jgi:hypothetical protein
MSPAARPRPAHLRWLSDPRLSGEAVSRGHAGEVGRTGGTGRAALDGDTSVIAKWRRASSRRHLDQHRRGVKYNALHGAPTFRRNGSPQDPVAVSSVDGLNGRAVSWAIVVARATIMMTARVAPRCVTWGTRVTRVTRGTGHTGGAGVALYPTVYPTAHSRLCGAEAVDQICYLAKPANCDGRRRAHAVEDEEPWATASRACPKGGHFGTVSAPGASAPAASTTGVLVHSCGSRKPTVTMTTATIDGTAG